LIQAGRGGKSAWNRATTAYETVGSITEIGIDDKAVYVAGIYEDHFDANDKSFAEAVVAAGTTRSRKKGKTKGIHRLGVTKLCCSLGHHGSAASCVA
jgi:hypothetical protein